MAEKNVSRPNTFCLVVIPRWLSGAIAAGTWLGVTGTSARRIERGRDGQRDIERKRDRERVERDRERVERYRERVERDRERDRERVESGLSRISLCSATTSEQLHIL